MCFYFDNMKQVEGCTYQLVKFHNAHMDMCIAITNVRGKDMQIHFKGHKCPFWTSMLRRMNPRKYTFGQKYLKSNQEIYAAVCYISHELFKVCDRYSCINMNLLRPTNKCQHITWEKELVLHWNPIWQPSSKATYIGAKHPHGHMHDMQLGPFISRGNKHHYNKQWKCNRLLTS